MMYRRKRPSVAGAVSLVKTALSERGRSETADESLEEIEYPMHELDRYFEGGAGSTLTD
jgi:hypothetical protein